MASVMSSVVASVVSSVVASVVSSVVSSVVGASGRMGCVGHSVSSAVHRCSRQGTGQQAPQS